MNPSLARLPLLRRERVCLVDSAQHKACAEDEEGGATYHQGHRGGGEDNPGQEPAAQSGEVSPGLRPFLTACQPRHQPSATAPRPHPSGHPGSVSPLTFSPRSHLCGPTHGPQTPNARSHARPPREPWKVNRAKGQSGANIPQPGTLASQLGWKKQTRALVGRRTRQSPGQLSSRPWRAGEGPSGVGREPTACTPSGYTLDLSPSGASYWRLEPLA